MAQIIIPTPLRKFTGNAKSIEVSGNTIEEAINSLTSRFPSLKVTLIDEDGKLRSYVNLFIGDTNVKDLKRDKTAVDETSVISIIPAIAGGKQ